MKCASMLAMALVIVFHAGQSKAQLYAYDAKGVKIGVLLRYAWYAFYNEKINRFISFNTDGSIVVGDLTYESTDCTGQPYHAVASTPGAIYMFGNKLYETAQTKTTTLKSYRNADGSCAAFSPQISGSYTAVNEYTAALPFTVPLQLPLSYGTARAVTVLPMN